LGFARKRHVWKCITILNFSTTHTLWRQQDDLKTNVSLVNGGWSSWSAWGGCPVTCGGGLEQRDRTCTNPRPALFGDHCFGNNHEDRICARQSCTGSFLIFVDCTCSIARINAKQCLIFCNTYSFALIYANYPNVILNVCILFFNMTVGLIKLI